MDWNSISHFIDMDGHGFFVWSAYGMTILAIVIELLSLKARRAKAVNRLTREARAVRATREGN